ncbi:MAG: GNAT family N-acetyltransferase [Balneolales bacterium]
MNNTYLIDIITPENYRNAPFTPGQIADFLYEHLDQFGDPREYIMRCINYALGMKTGRSGFIVTASDAHRDRDSEMAGSSNKNSFGDTDSGNSAPINLLGTTVVCETDMRGYVPENLVVYIAVDAKARGRGIGKALMEKAVEIARGDLALHVEPDNPAKNLYERIGFTHKYLEMRYSK